MKENNSSKMKRKKRRKYRLLVLLLLMFGTGVMLATSTYAWFTSNKTVTVSTLKVTINAKNGLQISTDATNWKSVISNEDIINARKTYGGSTNQIPTTMEPVSTFGDVDEDGRMKMFYGTVGTNEATGDYTLSAVQDIETETRDADNQDAYVPGGKFIAFDLFFQVNKATTINITKDSGVSAAKLSEEALTADDTGIKNASRFGFIVEGNTPAGTAVETTQGLKVTSSNTRKIWEPNNDLHTPGGIANARDAYKIITTDGGTAVPYYGVKADIAENQNVVVDSKNTAYFGEIATLNADGNTGFITTANQFEDFEFITLQPGVTKVRIYMWVEGQDVDCENNASGGAINYNLKFTVASDELTEPKN